MTKSCEEELHLHGPFVEVSKPSLYHVPPTSNVDVSFPHLSAKQKSLIATRSLMVPVYIYQTH